MDTIKLLKSYVDRALRVKAEIADLQADLAHLYKEAGNKGLDKKALKEVVKRAGMTSEETSDAQQFDLLIEMYWSNYMSGQINELFGKKDEASRARTPNAHTV